MKRLNLGFTLIELLVVISIIGIILGFTTFNFIESRRLVRDEARKTELKNLKSALEQYRADNSYYPYFSSTDFSTNFWDVPTKLIEGVNSNTGKQMGLTTPITYMRLKDIPQDSTNSCRFLYYHDAEKQKYTIFLILENVNDKDALSNTKPLPNGPNASDSANCIDGASSGQCLTFRISSGVCATTIYNYWENNSY